MLDYAFTGAAERRGHHRRRPHPGVGLARCPTTAASACPARITVELDEEGLELSRTGTGLSMKIQAKDCAQGGIFQMEPQRGDGTRTRIVHTLATRATRS